MLTMAKVGLPAIGDPLGDGYFAGIIDSTQSGSIPGADYYSTGQRYALIDLGAAGESGSTLQYKTANTAAPSECSTVWNGLGATQAMISAGAAYPAAAYAASYESSNPAPGKASAAYIPAMWELLSMYWHFKPFTTANYTTNTTGASFPFSPVVQGVDPVSDPQRPAFTTSVPGQTSLLPWKTGGAQAFGSAGYWTATEYASLYSWQLVLSTAAIGRLGNFAKTSSDRVRLVRRLVL